MKIIEAIEIKNYKSVISDKIELEDKTALVGANESGKSNILDALNHLNINKQKKGFLSNEQNISVKHSNNDKIEIDYHINLTKSIAAINNAFLISSLVIVITVNVSRL